MEPQISPNTPKPFPGAFDLFSPSVTAIGRNILTQIGLIAIPAGLYILAITASIVAIFAATDGGSGSIVLLLLMPMIVVATLSCLAVLPYFTVLQLRSVQGKKVSFGAIFRETAPYYWRLLGLRISQGLLYFAGMLLFIVPFFFWWKRYMLARYYVVDQNLSIGAAMKASSADSDRFGEAIWGIVGVRTLWWLVGQIVGVVGSIIDFVYGCAPALRYLQIRERIQAEAPHVAHAHHTTHTDTGAPTTGQ